MLCFAFAFLFSAYRIGSTRGIFPLLSRLFLLYPFPIFPLSSRASRDPQVSYLTRTYSYRRDTGREVSLTVVPQPLPTKPSEAQQQPFRISAYSIGDLVSSFFALPVEYSFGSRFPGFRIRFRRRLALLPNLSLQAPDCLNLLDYPQPQQPQTAPQPPDDLRLCSLF